VPRLRLSDAKQSPSPPTDEVCGVVRTGLLNLAEVFPVFPSPRGCDAHGAKVNFVQTIDGIASRMRTGRPRTVPLEPSHQSPPQGWVLKREFSDAGRHVYVPNNRPRGNERDDDAEAERALQFLRSARAEEKSSHLNWLAQEYVPTLASVGELRYMCIDGSPERAVITGRRPSGETWSTEGIKTMKGLREIQSALPTSSSTLTPSHEAHQVAHRTRTAGQRGHGFRAQPGVRRVQKGQRRAGELR
jgi:hypothetical protein